MNLNKQKVSKIFNILKEGKFINANSPKKEENILYNYIEDHYDDLNEYFSYIDINLVLKDGYCYFSSLTNKEQKLHTILELIDIISFLYEVNSSFDIGYNFLVSELVITIKDNTILLKKLNKIKSINADNLETKINLLLQKIEKKGFITIKDEYKKEYVVLNSFNYLIQFFNKIEIKE